MPVKIKYNEGRTLLTLWRVLLIFAICILAGGSSILAGFIHDFFSSSAAIAGSLFTDEELEEDPSLRALYYYQPAADGNGGAYIYLPLYLSGSGDNLGLRDGTGQQILPEQYQDIAPLPNAWLVKQNGQWMFIDKDTLEPLNDLRWDSAQVDVNDSHEITSNLVVVSRDGLYGAVDLAGNLVIEPAYDSFQTNSEALWPIIKVEKQGKFGFIDYDGNVVVSITYDYAVLDSTMVYEDENDSVGTEIPIIYVYRDGRWGAMYRQGDTSSAVYWSVEPSVEVMNDFSGNNLPENSI